MFETQYKCKSFANLSVQSILETMQSQTGKSKQITSRLVLMLSNIPHNIDIFLSNNRMLVTTIHKHESTIDFCVIVSFKFYIHDSDKRKHIIYDSNLIAYATQT